MAHVVREDTKSEEGWLWLGRSLSDNEQRKYCYDKVLRLNPEHVEAQNELDRLFLSNVKEKSSFAQDSLDEIPGRQTQQDNSKADWKSNPTFLSIIGIIHFRIDDISRSLGTLVPTYTPLP